MFSPNYNFGPSTDPIENNLRFTRRVIKICPNLPRGEGTSELLTCNFFYAQFYKDVLILYIALLIIPKRQNPRYFKFILLIWLFNTCMTVWLYDCINWSCYICCLFRFFQKQGKHSARKPPKLIILQYVKQASKLQDAQTEKLTSWEAHKLANW